MATERWTIDTSHSSVDFVVRHMVVSKVRGTFGKWSGEIELDPQDPAKAKASARIEVASIDTREAQRDGHLKSADFFDAEKFPEITFTSKRIEPKSATEVRVVGDLTIHGETREVVLEAELLGRGKDPWGNERAGFSARTSINRTDYGLRWNQVLEAGGLLVGEKIEIEVDVEAVRAKDAA